MTRHIQQLRVLPHAENMPRPPGHRLRAVPAQGKTRSWLLAAAELESPSSATRKAALEQWSAKAIRLLPRLMGRDVPPRHLSRIRLSVAALAAERESEKTMLAIGSTDSTDLWRWKKKMSWVPPASDLASGTSPFPKGSRSPETRPNIPAP